MPTIRSKRWGRRRIGRACGWQRYGCYYAAIVSCCYHSHDGVQHPDKQQPYEAAATLLLRLMAGEVRGLVEAAANGLVAEPAMGISAFLGRLPIVHGTRQQSASQLAHLDRERERKQSRLEQLCCQPESNLLMKRVCLYTTVTLTWFRVGRLPPPGL